MPRFLSQRGLNILIAVGGGAVLLAMVVAGAQGRLNLWGGQLAAVATSNNGNKVTVSGAGTYTVTVPSGVTSMVVKLWGGGGMSTAASGHCYAQCGGYNFCSYGGFGGGGGYTSVTVPVTAGQTLTVVVGAGNGGYSGVFNGATVSQGTALAIAGGGGTAGGGSCVGGNPGCGAGYSCSGPIPDVSGGPGGGAVGSNSGGSYATGGTQSAGGTGGQAGAALAAGGNGGVGYFGGGGRTQLAGDSISGGGGGSGYCTPSASACTLTAGSGTTAGNPNDVDRTSGAGNADQEGYAVVYFITASLSLTAQPSNIPSGGSATLAWQGQNTIPGSCKITNANDSTIFQDGSSVTYNYTGADQTYSVPGNVTAVFAEIWGAGGGGTTGCASGDTGGAGGYTQGMLNVTPGQQLTVIVGGAGAVGGATRPYGGGGSAWYYNATWYGSSGGGRSAVRNAAGTELMTAGGGGGTGPWSNCTAMATPTTNFAENAVRTTLAFLTQPQIAYAGISLPPGPGYPGGGLSGTYLGGGSPYQGGDGGGAAAGSGGGGGYVGGAGSSDSQSGGNGGTGYCGTASGCTSVTGYGSPAGQNGKILLMYGNTSGNVPVGPFGTLGTYTYKLSCQDYTGASVSANTQVTVMNMDICTDIPGVQPTVPLGCQTPNPSPGACIPPGYGWNGSACQALCPNGTGFAGSCTSCNSPYVLSGGNCVQPNGFFNQGLTAKPAHVVSGNATTLSWSVSYMASCGVTGSNGTTPAAQSASNATDGTHSVSSGTITGPVVYTLRCTDHNSNVYTSSVQVTTLPKIQEI